MIEDHGIEELDNPAFANNEPAWHGLGTVLPGMGMDSTKALQVAQLMWRVELENVYSRDGIEVPDTFVTVRDDLAKTDKRRLLGTVGNRYTPIQHEEVAHLGDSLLQESGAHWETVGSLRNGRVVWMLARLPKGQIIVDDPIAQYLLLRTSHDASSSLTCLLTPIRVVCNNTLAAAVGGKGNKVHIRHTRGATVKIEETRRVLRLADEHFEQHAKRMGKLAEVKVDDRFAEAFVNTLYPDKENTNNTRAQNARATVRSLWNGKQAGATRRAVQGTAYGLFNAFTEYLDHHTEPENSKKSPRALAETRFETALYGNNAGRRQVAFDLISRATGADGRGVGLATQVLEHEARTGSGTDAMVDTLLGQLDLG